MAEQIAELDTVHTRLERMVNVFAKGNKSAFGRKTGIHSSVLADILGGRMNKPSFDILLRLLTAFPQIRMEWLLFGTGNMLRAENNPYDLGVLLMSTKHQIAQGSSASNPEEINHELEFFRSKYALIKRLEPAFKDVEAGIFPRFDAVDVLDYYEVLGDLEKTITATEHIINELIESRERRRLAEHLNASASQSTKRFIEVQDTKGQRNLVALSAISHVYPLDSNGDKTSIELITMRGTENVIIDSTESYDSLKALLEAEC